MVVYPEKQLLWHPQRSEQRFVVGSQHSQQGGQIMMYEWNPSHAEIKHVNSIGDLKFMKCFDWYPTTTVGDIFAVGTTAGKIDLIRLNENVSYGNHVRSPPTFPLSFSTSRACHCLSFNRDEPNLLAAGLDKVRGESSLLVYDIDSLLPLSTSSSYHPEGSQHKQSRPIAQFVTGEMVTSVAFLPQSTKLVAGVSQKSLRLFDLKSPSVTNSNTPSAASRSVHGIATDPFDWHRIACFGDGTVSIWDFRNPSSPLITFADRDATADGARNRLYSQYMTLEFSSDRRGLLASLERETRQVRFWNVMEAAVFDGKGAGSQDSQPPAVSRLSWANPSNILPWTTVSDVAAPPSPDHIPQPSYCHVLSDTRPTKEFSIPLSSFALVPEAHSHTRSPTVLVVSKEGDLQMHAMSSASHLRWSSGGELAVGSGNNLTIFYNGDSNGDCGDPWEVPLAPYSELALPDLHPRPSLPLRPGQPGFGRGDKDGFPALSPKVDDQVLSSTKRLVSGTIQSPPLSAIPSANTSPTRDGIYSAEHNRQQPLLRSKTPPPSAKTDKQPTGTSRGRSRYTSELKTSLRAMQDDISLVMKDRAHRGYSLGNALHNATVRQDDPLLGKALSDIWKWIGHCENTLGTSSNNILGYDFSYQGILGLWDSLSSQQPYLHPLFSEELSSEASASSLDSNFESIQKSMSPKLARGRSVPEPGYGTFPAALNMLLSQHEDLRKTIRISVPTGKPDHRALALRLCGFLVGEDDVDTIKRWEKEGKRRKAACWAVFAGRTNLAIELLTKSKEEKDKLVAGMLAVLSETSTHLMSRMPQIKEQYNRLIPQLDDVYLRAMLYHLALEDWSEVLTENLPIHERITIALRYLPDAELSDYLRKQVDISKRNGDLLGLMLTGLTPAGLDILQGYVDLTGDVQTATLLGGLVCPSKFDDPRVGRWLHSYQDLLMSWRMFSHRNQLDVQHGKLIQAVHQSSVRLGQWRPHVAFRCNSCSKTIPVGRHNTDISGSASPLRDISCPECGRSLSRCSICLLPVGVPLDVVRNSRSPQDIINYSLLFCHNCRHGGHAVHILGWFEGTGDELSRQAHDTCPVADCNCHCLNEPAFN